MENTDSADTSDSLNTGFTLLTKSIKKKEKRLRGRRVTLDPSNIDSDADAASMNPIIDTSGTAIAAITPLVLLLSIVSLLPMVRV